MCEAALRVRARSSRPESVDESENVPPGPGVARRNDFAASDGTDGFLVGALSTDTPARAGRADSAVDDRTGRTLFVGVLFASPAGVAALLAPATLAGRTEGAGGVGLVRLVARRLAALVVLTVLELLCVRTLPFAPAAGVEVCDAERTGVVRGRTATVGGVALGVRGDGPDEGLASALVTDAGGDADAAESERCPLATEVRAALRLSTAARMWMGPASRSPSSRGSRLCAVGEAAKAPDAVDDVDAVRSLLVATGAVARGVDSDDRVLAGDLADAAAPAAGLDCRAAPGRATSLLGGAIGLGGVSGRTRSVVATSSSSASSLRHHLSSRLNPPSARTLIQRFLR